MDGTTSPRSGRAGASLAWDDSGQLSGADAPGFHWTPMYVAWAGVTVIALILLAAGPSLRERWRSR